MYFLYQIDIDTINLINMYLLICYSSIEIFCFKKLKQSRDYYHHDSLKHSICIPKACPNVPENVYQTGEDNNEDLMKYVNECYNKKYTQYDLEGRVENIFCQDAGPLQQVDGFDKLVA